MLFRRPRLGALEAEVESVQNLAAHCLIVESPGAFTSPITSTISFRISLADLPTNVGNLMSILVSSVVGISGISETSAILWTVFEVIECVRHIVKF